MSEDQYDNLIHAACGAYGLDVDDENLVPVAELVRAGLAKTRMHDGCVNIVATKLGVRLLLNDGKIEADPELGGFMRVRRKAA